MLHLRSGDAVTCQVSGIDEQGVSIKSDTAEAGFVPHEQIKALELAPNVSPVKIDKTKKERLLTLPRMQRDNPPTQLIRSLEGDYLRGRLLSMDAKQLQVELRLENKTLPREHVARIIWLHADEIEGASRSDRSLEEPAGIRVQSVPRGGNRLTFFAKELAGDVLSGHSAVLGACRVNLAEIDQLLIGDAIEQAAATLAFHGWKTHAGARAAAHAGSQRRNGWRRPRIGPGGQAGPRDRSGAAGRQEVPAGRP